MRWLLFILGITSIVFKSDKYLDAIDNKGITKNSSNLTDLSPENLTHKNCLCGIHLNISEVYKFLSFIGPQVACIQPSVCTEFCLQLYETKYKKINRCQFFMDFTKMQTNVYWQLCDSRWTKIDNVSDTICCKNKRKFLCSISPYNIYMRQVFVSICYILKMMTLYLIYGCFFYSMYRLGN